MHCNLDDCFLWTVCYSRHTNQGGGMCGGWGWGGVEVYLCDAACESGLETVLIVSRRVKNFHDLVSFCCNMSIK